MQADHLHALLRSLNPDAQEAGVIYRQIHQRLIRFFRLNNAIDPEALADEAMDRLARRIEEGEANEIGSPHAFALGIGRHLLFEDVRRRRRDDQVTSEWVRISAATNPNREPLLLALDECMERMREDQRQLLRLYYQWSGQQKIEHHRQLAKDLGLTVNALRNRLMRARTELDKCIHKRCSDVLPQKNTKS
jgi:RNA polymerase sigma factor (sigma-70 family)